jgi:RNA polymerase sigma-70 factor (ECF subfamily)
VVGRILAGDTAAFEALVARYQERLLRVARGMLRNHADAGDATQVTFAKVFAKLRTYDRTRPFSNWVHRILRNECLNVLRARHPQEPLTSELPDTSDPLSGLEDVERERQVQAAVNALPRDHREAVVLRHFAERSYQEIGMVLGIPEKTVKSRLFSARRRLARLLVTSGLEARPSLAR